MISNMLIKEEIMMEHMIDINKVMHMNNQLEEMNMEIQLMDEKT